MSARSVNRTQGLRWKHAVRDCCRIEYLLWCPPSESKAARHAWNAWCQRHDRMRGPTSSEILQLRLGFQLASSNCMKHSLVYAGSWRTSRWPMQSEFSDTKWVQWHELSNRPYCTSLMIAAQCHKTKLKLLACDPYPDLCLHEGCAGAFSADVTLNFRGVNPKQLA